MTKPIKAKRKLQTLDYYLSGEPVSIDEYTWMYPQAKGILVVHEVWGKDARYIRTDKILIPFKKIAILAQDLKEARYNQKHGARII